MRAIGRALVITALMAAAVIWSVDMAGDEFKEWVMMVGALSPLFYKFKLGGKCIDFRLIVIALSNHTFDKLLQLLNPVTVVINKARLAVQVGAHHLAPYIAPFDNLLLRLNMLSGIGTQRMQIAPLCVGVCL